MARETPPAATPRHRHVGVVATWDEVESRDIARSFARCPARATRLAAPRRDATRRAPPIINTTRARARPARRLVVSAVRSPQHTSATAARKKGATIGKVFGWRRKEGKKRKRKEKKRSCFWGVVLWRAEKEGLSCLIQRTVQQRLDRWVPS
uniref:Uncharacterized protein n=2 Tax=Oryza sativa TaxID=4530 RepID=Q651S4_ORYSJ|nr:hypothetical protein [Oryza sativa Japonica Group]BAX24618.1 hypothetical protein [Oryza sativa Indica Group]